MGPCTAVNFNLNAIRKNRRFTKRTQTRQPLKTDPFRAARKTKLGWPASFPPGSLDKHDVTWRVIINFGFDDFDIKERHLRRVGFRACE